MRGKVKTYLKQYTETATLAVFRIFFGLLIFVSILRFYVKGWIYELYIKPNFYFSYYGFDWVKPIGNYTYLLFGICGLSAFFVMIGYKYRLAILSLFLSFTYIELMDKSNYLNHYYFVSLVCFILCFLPANANFSVDAFKNRNIIRTHIPKLFVDAIKFILFIVYFYAGLAKLNSDWLFLATPMNIWMSVRHDYYLLGQFMREDWLHYFLSWSGAIYDLCIPFLLLFTPTRKIAFVLVVVFHLITSFLFPIGMFPYVMIASSIVFFDSRLHHKILRYIFNLFKINYKVFIGSPIHKEFRNIKMLFLFFSIFFFIQLVFPFRYLLYPGELFWTEEGYRFSWRVMLVEKAGFAEFRVKDNDTGKIYTIDNSDFLSKHQEKQMCFQSDFILQYAHYLGDVYKSKGINSPSVYVDNVVTLNGRLSTMYVKKNVDLYKLKESLSHKDWIVEFSDKKPIIGF